jgi:hypothetical protein
MSKLLHESSTELKLPQVHLIEVPSTSLMPEGEREGDSGNQERGHSQGDSSVEGHGSAAPRQQLQRSM